MRKLRTHLLHIHLLYTQNIYNIQSTRRFCFYDNIACASLVLSINTSYLTDTHLMDILRYTLARTRIFLYKYLSAYQRQVALGVLLKSVSDHSKEVQLLLDTYDFGRRCLQDNIRDFRKCNGYYLCKGPSNMRAFMHHPQVIPLK